MFSQGIFLFQETLIKLILVHIYLFSKVFLSSSSDESTTLVTTLFGLSVVELESNLVVPADDS